MFLRVMKVVFFYKSLIGIRVFSIIVFALKTENFLNLCNKNKPSFLFEIYIDSIRFFDQAQNMEKKYQELKERK